MRESIDIKTGTNDKGETTALELRVYYSKGGASYMSYKQEPRGYYMMLTPVAIGEGFRSFMITPGTSKGGFKQCMEVTKRLNRNRLTHLQCTVLAIDPDIIKELWDLQQYRAIYHQCLDAAGIEIVEVAA